MMSGREKLYFLLNRIDDVREISPSGQPLKIHPMNDLNGNYKGTELTQLFTKLEKDEQILKVLKAPSRIQTIDFVEGIIPDEPAPENDDGCWHIELLPTFDEYFTKIQNEPEYQNFSSSRLSNQQVQNKPQSKPNRKVLEKIWNVLQEIEEKRQLATDGDEIQIPKYPYSSNISSDWDNYYQERKAILPKLVSLGAIKDLRKGEEGAWQFWGFHIGDKYFDVFSKYEEEYKMVAQDYQQSHEEEKVDAKDITYEVKYSEKSREILINNFLLAKPDFNSENEVVFSYLYRNANRPVKTEELEQQLGNKLKKPIHNILRDLGFTGKFASVFFNASKNAVMFRNPVTYQDLKDLGVDKLKIQEKK